MTESTRPEPLAEALAGMARDLLSQETVQDTLNRIVDHAVRLVDGCEAAGLMVVRGGRAVTLAATDEVVRVSERLQGELGEGPCFEAYEQTAPVFRVGDISQARDRWPRYAPKARELGVASTMAFLLFTGEENHLGALNLYSSVPNAFTESSERVGVLLASHAAVAFAGARHESQLRDAIATRQSIGEAVGIVMERHKVDADAAFAVLARASQNTNKKLHEVAGEVSRTGEIPSAVASDSPLSSSSGP